MMRIFLAVSCFFLSLTVAAQTAETNAVESSVKSIAPENSIEKFTQKNTQDALQESNKSPIQADSQTASQQYITEQAVPQREPLKQKNADAPQVGKHVFNMDAVRMILSLLMVLVLIIVCALVLKRFNFTQQGISQLKVVTSLSLGTKERVMVVQVGEQQLLLGVTAQQITVLEKLSEPLSNQSINTTDLPKNILSFLSAKRS